MNHIYQYEDYRKLIGDLFQDRKKQDPKFSHRKFAIEAEIRNPGYLIDVIKGKRTVSDEMVQKMGRIFKLKPREIEFLQLLVEFGQAKKDGERQTAYKKIQQRRKRSHFVRVDPSKTKYYEETIYALILATIQVVDFKGDFQELANAMTPPMPAGKVEKAVKELLEWGLLKRVGITYYVTNKFLEPPTGMNSLIRRMNKTWIEEGADATFRFSPEDRHVSTILLSVSQNAQDKILERIEKCRQEILELVEEEEDADRVMQLSMQFFPRSRRRRQS